MCGAVDPVTGAVCHVPVQGDHIHTTEGDGNKSFVFKWTDFTSKRKVESGEG